MIEKIKDILYDLTDFILVLIIVVFMVSVISIKVTDSLSINPFNIINNTLKQNELAVDNTEGTDNIESNLPDIETNITIEEPTNQKPEEILIEPDPNLDTEENKPEEKNEVKELKITIKSGSTGYDIAKLLKSNKLIEDTQVFISRVEELKLGAKLRSGTFKLNSSLSLDDIIFIIAGKN
ncbi:hypothetical protein QUF55_06430 [Clostridiaceae bacterium HSG29]|nr:hypothetical protein [Clostridiaceae bacterium HSG29]